MGEKGWGSAVIPRLTAACAGSPHRQWEMSLRTSTTRLTVGTRGLPGRLQGTVLKRAMEGRQPLRRSLCLERLPQPDSTGRSAGKGRESISHAGGLPKERTRWKSSMTGQGLGGEVGLGTGGG